MATLEHWRLVRMETLLLDVNGDTENAAPECKWRCWKYLCWMRMASLESAHIMGNVLGHCGGFVLFYCDTFFFYNSITVIILHCFSLCNRCIHRCLFNETCVYSLQSFDAEPNVLIGSASVYMSMHFPIVCNELEGGYILCNAGHCANCLLRFAR